MAFPTAAAAQAEAELQAALERRGLRWRRIEALREGPARRGRHAWRVDLSDGRTLKLRRLESEEAASSLHALRDRIETAFAPVLERDGALLLEVWVEGTLLGTDEAEARAEEAGRLLGRLHATPLPVRSDAVATRDWRAATLMGLARLEGERWLAAPEVRRLREIVLRDDPSTTPRALLHRDYCAENMLVDRSGRLRVIDNEWLLVEAAGFDLGRTRSRWPLSPAGWRRFLRGYAAEAGRDPGPLGFWEVVGGVWSVAVRLRDAPEQVAAPLAALRQLLEDA